MLHLLLFGYLTSAVRGSWPSGAFAMSNCKVIQRRIVSIHPCPSNNRVPCEVGSHPDSQAPCVVYHQISTPFPADEELVRIDVREHSIEARLCLFHPSHLIGDLRIFTHKASQRKNGVHLSQIKNGGMWVDRNSTSLLAVLEPLAWSCVPKWLFPTSSNPRLV